MTCIIVFNAESDEEKAVEGDMTEEAKGRQGAHSPSAEQHGPSSECACVTHIHTVYIFIFTWMILLAYECQLVHV